MPANSTPAGGSARRRSMTAYAGVGARAQPLRMDQAVFSPISEGGYAHPSHLGCLPDIRPARYQVRPPSQDFGHTHVVRAGTVRRSGARRPCRHASPLQTSE